MPDFASTTTGPSSRPACRQRLEREQRRRRIAARDSRPGARCGSPPDAARSGRRPCPSGSAAVAGYQRCRSASLRMRNAPDRSMTRTPRSSSCRRQLRRRGFGQRQEDDVGVARRGGRRRAATTAPSQMRASAGSGRGALVGAGRHRRGQRDRADGAPGCAPVPVRRSRWRRQWRRGSGLWSVGGRAVDVRAELLGPFVSRSVAKEYLYIRMYKQSRFGYAVHRT